jgi:hypothetical protein
VAGGDNDGVGNLLRDETKRRGEEGGERGGKGTRGGRHKKVRGIHVGGGEMAEIEYV